MLYIAIASLVAAASVLTYAFYAIARLPTGGFIPVDYLGTIERNIQNLKRVIVIADHIEDPERDLRVAVQDNFRRGVHYLFLISQRNAIKERDGYYKIFKTLAEIIIDKHNLPVSVEHLVSIGQLPYDWPDYPYVFYETQASQDAQPSFIAFRGNQQKEGIAELYSSVPRYYAHTIAKAVLSEGPQPIKVSSEQFQDPSSVLNSSASKTPLSLVKK